MRRVLMGDDPRLPATAGEATLIAFLQAPLRRPFHALMQSARARGERSGLPENMVLACLRTTIAVCRLHSAATTAIGSQRIEPLSRGSDLAIRGPGARFYPDESVRLWMNTAGTSALFGDAYQLRFLHEEMTIVGEFTNGHVGRQITCTTSTRSNPNLHVDSTIHPPTSSGLNFRQP